MFVACSTSALEQMRSELEDAPQNAKAWLVTNTGNMHSQERKTVAYHKHPVAARVVN